MLFNYGKNSKLQEKQNALGININNFILLSSNLYLYINNFSFVIKDLKMKKNLKIQPEMFLL